ncbi:MAG: hypothetical protein LBB15_02020 [Puniceicoccales bacterium]|nr:hypothetical protein [Puniceicoccales bacterium]
MAVDPNLDFVQPTLPDSLRANDSSTGGCAPMEECAGIVACEFQGHSIGFLWRSCAGDFSGINSRAKYTNCSLGTRSVLAKRSISSFVHIARDVSQLRNSLVKGFVRLRRDSKVTGDYLRGLEEELRTIFTPIFMSRGESARELNRIRSFVGVLLESFDKRSAKQMRNQCNYVLECGGAMALFGVLRSVLKAVK